MKTKMDLLIEKLIRNKFKNIDLAKKDKRISLILDKKEISLLSKRDKLELVKILSE
jgi:hypothetical protein